MDDAVLATGTTFLFTPADRPDRFSKADASGADLVILDLEDGVQRQRKADGRRNVVEATASATVRPFVIRVNGADSPEHDEDLRALRQILDAGRNPAGVMVPKVGAASDLRRLRQVTEDRIPVVAQIESARGTMALPGICADRSVVRIAMGLLDLASDMDVDASAMPIALACAQAVLVSRAEGLPSPIASPSVALRDEEAVGVHTRQMRAWGFGAQLAVHPAQLASIRLAFAPTEADLTWARAVVGEDRGAADIDGSMVDRPVRDRAARILGRAARLTDAIPHVP